MSFFRKISCFFFKKETCTASHNSFRILGCRIAILKKEIKKKRAELSEYYHSFSSPQMIPPAEGNLRLIQRASAKFLKNFDRFCKDNAISWFLDCGALLGSIRHGGFIPWDDDVDIGMMREDYDRLYRLCQDGAGEKYGFTLTFESNHWNKCLPKIQSLGSKNVFIDIFPYDYYCENIDSPEKKLAFSRKLNRIRKIKCLKRIHDIDKLRERLKQVTEKFLLNGRKRRENEKVSLFLSIDFPHKWKNKVYDWEMIFPLSEVSFEGMSFPAPNKPAAILENIYGNYMTIPGDSYPRHVDYINVSDEEKDYLTRLADSSIE